MAAFDEKTASEMVAKSNRLQELAQNLNLNGSDRELFDAVIDTLKEAERMGEHLDEVPLGFLPVGDCFMRPLL